MVSGSVLVNSGAVDGPGVSGSVLRNSGAVVAGPVGSVRNSGAVSGVSGTTLGVSTAGLGATGAVLEEFSPCGGRVFLGVDPESCPVAFLHKHKTIIHLLLIHN